MITTSLLFIVFLAVMWSAWLRLHAALTNDRPIDRSKVHDGKRPPIRRYGFPFHNRFVLDGQFGWRRVRSKYRGEFIIDLPRESRLILEHDAKWERRKYLLFYGAFIGWQIIEVGFFIWPYHLSDLIELRDYRNIIPFYTVALVNASAIAEYPLRYFGVYDAGIFRWLILYLLLAAPAIVFLYAFIRTIKGLFNASLHIAEEIGYQLGIQWVHGAKVYDAPLEALRFTSDTQAHSQRASSSKHWPFSDWWARLIDRVQRYRTRPHQAKDQGDERARRPDHDADISFEDACRVFGLEPHQHFTQEEVTAAFRKVSKRLHPDPHDLVFSKDMTAAFQKLQRCKEIVEAHLARSR